MLETERSGQKWPNLVRGHCI